MFCYAWATLFIRTMACLVLLTSKIDEGGSRAPFALYSQWACYTMCRVSTLVGNPLVFVGGNVLECYWGFEQLNVQIGWGKLQWCGGCWFCWFRSLVEKKLIAYLRPCLIDTLFHGFLRKVYELETCLAHPAEGSCNKRYNYCRTLILSFYYLLWFLLLLSEIIAQ